MGYYDNIPEIETNLDGAELRIGIVMSRFNIEIGEGLLGACSAELAQLGVQHANIRLGTVPGALEANESANGLMKAQLETGIPIINAILTTDTEDQATSRMSQKGKDAARVAVEMANLFDKLVEFE